MAGPTELRYLSYTMRSGRQAYPNELRILLPDAFDRIDEPKLLYVLPVNPDVSMRWHDGLITIKQTDLHNRYGLIVAAPSFSNWPWYADHPTDQRSQQESYFVEEVVPFVDALYPEAGQKRLLLGFSKSGNGAFSLLLRHPDLFRAAAVWDAPLMKAAPDQFEMPDIYGTPENFEKYRVSRLLQEQAELLRGRPPRLALFGYGLFGGPNPALGDHIGSAHDLMLRLRIPHIFDSSVEREHCWDSGWMESAVAALDYMSTRPSSGSIAAEQAGRKPACMRERPLPHHH